MPQRNLATVGDQDFFKHGNACDGLLNMEQGLTVLNRLSVVTQNAGNGAGLVGLDLIEDLHGLNDADGFAFFDHRANFHKGLGARR